MAKMGGARTFFTVYASIKSAQILDDAHALGATLTAVFTDAIEGMMIAFEEVFMGFDEWNAALMDLAGPIEMAAIHFEKFFDDNIKMAEELEIQIISIGAAFNQSAAQSLEAAAIMEQLGAVVGGPTARFGATQAAMLLGGVGMMNTEAAMQAIMQLQMQTNFMYEGLTKSQRELLTADQERAFVLSNTIALVDRLNEVENRSGATIQGLIQAMNQYASAASLVNTSLDEQIALGATLIEQGEQASKAGRSIKQILARLASDRSQNNELLAQYGVKVRENNGDMLTLMQIIKQLEPQWDALNSTQQTNIAIAVAGAHHYVRFIKLMEGYDRTMQIMAVSQNSANSAMKEFGVFLTNDFYQMEQLRKETEKVQYLIAKEMLPINRQMLEMELMRVKVQYLLIAGNDTYWSDFLASGVKGALVWLHVASSVFQATKGILAFVLAIRLIGVAQQTLIAITKQLTYTQGLIVLGKTQEIIQTDVLMEQEDMMVTLKVNGLLTDQSMNKVLGHRILIRAWEHNQILATLQLNKAQYELLEGTTFLRQSGSRMLKHDFDLIRASLRLEILKVDAMGDQLIAAQTKLKITEDEISAKIMSLGFMGPELSAKRAIITQEIIGGKIVREATVFEINMLKAKINLLKLEGTAILLKTDGVLQYNQVALRGHRIAFDEAYARVIVMEAIEMGNMASLKSIDISLLKTTVAKLEIEGIIGLADAELLLGQAQMTRIGINRVAMMTSMSFMNIMMMASMGVMMFSKSEHAAEAGAVLMTLALIPLIGMTMLYSAAMKEAGTATIIATAGFSLVAAAIISIIALEAAKRWDFFGDNGMMAGLDDLQEDIDKAAADTEIFMKEMETMMADLDIEMAEMGDGFGNTMDDMEESMASFDDKRLEIFFGGRRSAMDAAMFRELKQNGIENLYFAPELYVTNNFNGLTFEDAAERIVRTIEARLKDSGALQLA